MDKSSLGDRIKSYENCFRYYIPQKTNVIVRLDGKAFHSYTKGFDRPFDQDLIDCMVQSAIAVAKEMQGFKIGYVQSDEVSFWLNDLDEIKTEAWFGNNLAKIISVAASMMTANFNNLIKKTGKSGDRLAYFDGRAFIIPQNDVENYFLWRLKDFERNSLSMYCSSFFSSKQLHGKKRDDKHEMLHEIGKNWSTDLSDQHKNGTFFYKGNDGFELEHSISPSYLNVAEFFDNVLFEYSLKGVDDAGQLAQRAARETLTRQREALLNFKSKENSECLNLND